MVSRRFISAAALIGAVYAQNEADATELAPNAIQTGSFFDGQQALGASDEQAPALTSQNNFINFCAGQTLTDGLQQIDGSCNGIPMGQIPAKANMITTIILSPQNGEEIQSGQDFRIELQTNGLIAGAFTNAVATYYSSPQFLQNGNVVGHTHVTVQDLGSSLNPQIPPDPQQFAFFRGINDQGNGDGRLFADVEGGLPPGNYRVCTLTSGANHQPVVMPVAQRGSQDDCTKFTVVGDDFDVNDRANNGANGIQAAEDAAAAVELGPGAIEDEANVGEDEADVEVDAEADAEAEAEAEVDAQEDVQNNNNNNGVLGANADFNNQFIQNLLNNQGQGQNNNDNNNDAEAEADEDIEAEAEVDANADAEADQENANDAEAEAEAEVDVEQENANDVDEFVNDRANNGVNGLQAAADAAAAVALGPGALTANAEVAAETAAPEADVEEEVEVEEEDDSQAQDAGNNNNGGIDFEASRLEALRTLGIGQKRRRAVPFSS